MKAQKLPFAVRNGVVIGVADVDSGLHLDCICPSCGGALVAKKGNKVIHHFAHHRDTNCATAAETLLHLATKQILKGSGEMRVPEVLLSFESMKNPWLLKPAQLVKFDEIVAEMRVGSDIPDLVISANSRKLAIEVTVTHRTSHEKVARLYEAGYSVLEIDLSGQNRLLTLAELRQLVVEDISCKKWRFNRLEAYVRADVYRLSERKPLIWRGFALHVDNCPIEARVWRGRPYANVTDDCYQCNHCVGTGDSDESNPTPLLCLARSGIDNYSDWQSFRSPQSSAT